MSPDDALAEILEAAGIPQERPTRQLAKRDTYSVVGAGPPGSFTFTSDHYKYLGLKTMAAVIEVKPWPT